MLRLNFCMISLMLTYVAAAQNIARSLALTSINSTKNKAIYSYQFKYYNKTVGEIAVRLSDEGKAFVSPDTFICVYAGNYKTPNLSNIRMGFKDSTYYLRIYKNENQYSLIKLQQYWSFADAGYFLYSNMATIGRPEFYFKDSGSYSCKDTFMHGMNCYVVNYNENLTKKSNWNASTIYINKQDSFMVGFENTALFENFDTIYSGIFIHQYQVNQRYPTDSLRKALSRMQKIDDKTPTSRKPNNTLNIGETLPNIIIKDLFNNQELTLQFNKKVLLIDFWYMACYGCIKSYPVITKLHHEYLNNPEVQVISINPIDLNPNLSDKLKRYIGKYELASAKYKIDQGEFSKFKIKAYPTFLVVVDGVIIGIEEGAFPSLYDKLKQLIEQGRTKLNK